MVVLTFREDPALDRALEPGRLVLFQGLEIVQAAKEEQVSYLFDDFERVGDTAGPESVPDAVDLITQFTGEHGHSIFNALQHIHIM